MSRFPEYANYDGIGLAELVTRGDINAADLVEEAIARLERYNPQINAIVSTMYQQARAQLKQPLPSSPLSGVPFLIKDLDLNYKGTITTCGASFLLNSRPAVEDDELMYRYNQAGLITLGKTNTPEFGLIPATEGGVHGPCFNPWDLNHTPGGSSGGSAAAVAAGIVPIAHANDIGGSIRIPSSCCGLVGLKPSRGMMPYQVFIDTSLGLLQSGVISRTVRDTAAMLDIGAGPQLGSRYIIAKPKQSYLKAIEQPPAKLTIAIDDASFLNTPVAKECQAAVQNSARLCQSLGHVIEQARPNIDGERLKYSFLVVVAACTAKTLTAMQLALAKGNTDKLSANLAIYHKIGRSFTAEELVDAHEYLTQCGKEMAKFHQTYDVYLTPTLGQLPPRVGDFLPSALINALRTVGAKLLPGRLLFKMLMDDAITNKIFEFIPFTFLANTTGCPSLNLPLYMSGQGLPVGTLFNADRGNDLLLLRLAQQLEQAQPWFNNRPSKF